MIIPFVFSFMSNNNNYFYKFESKKKVLNHFEFFYLQVYIDVFITYNVCECVIYTLSIISILG